MTDTDKLNPKIDFVFRRLFGSEENKDLLISLINSVVEPSPHIVDVTIKNPFNLAAYRAAMDFRLSIFHISHRLRPRKGLPMAMVLSRSALSGSPKGNRTFAIGKPF